MFCLEGKKDVVIDLAGLEKLLDDTVDMEPDQRNLYIDQQLERFKK